MVIFSNYINISYPGTPGGTYKKQLYGQFPNINISYPSTPGGTYE